MSDVYYPKVKTKVGARQVLCTNVVHLCGGESCEIFLDDWSCDIIFKSDAGLSRYEVGLENAKLVICLFNHNNALGESIFNPFVLAQADNTIISMTYWTQLINAEGKMRRFEYTLWVEAQ